MKLVIVVEGGIVQEVFSDEGLADVVVVDKDSDMLPNNQVKVIEGKESYVYDGLKRTEVNPDRVEVIYKEAK